LTEPQSARQRVEQSSWREYAERENSYSEEMRNAPQTQEAKRRIATLCGSHRFKDTFEEVAQALGLSGWIVLRPAFAKDAHEYALPTDGMKGLKQILDDLHFDKIAMSDVVVVINQDGYIGESTKREIAEAQRLGKRIFWFQDRLEGWKDLLTYEARIKLPLWMGAL
jgi:hypothetical protein